MSEPEEREISELISPAVSDSRTARVVLPTKDEIDTDEEGDDLEHKGSQNPEEAVDVGDPLEDWPDDTEDIELIHARISSLSELGLIRFAASLRTLCLRQNFISKLDEDIFHELTKLESLDLYDNQIKHVGTALDKAALLHTLDLSFNLIKSVPEALAHLPSLKTVFFVQNRISHISGLDKCLNLTSLELGSNRIRRIENLECLVNLEELWLGKNKISKLENLDKLVNLKILSIQSNRITKIEGLESLTRLDQLYLSHNGIKKLEGLEHNNVLTTVDVGNNFIPKIEGVSHLTKLEEFWMSNNQIPTLGDLEPQLGHISTLNTIYLEGNPCQKEDMSGYRRKIMLALPQLQQIDATYVRGTV